MARLFVCLFAIVMTAAVAAADESRPLGPANPAPAQSRAADPSASSRTLDSPLIRTGGSLAVVLGLIFGLAALARRMNGKSSGSLAAAFGLGGAPSPSGLLEVLARYPLGRGQTLILLRIDTRILLLSQSSAGLRLRGGGGSGGGVSTLTQVTDPEEVASILVKVQDAEQASTAARFGELLGRFDARHGEHSETGTHDGVVDLTQRQPTPRNTPTRTGGDSLKARLGAMRGAR